MSSDIDYSIANSLSYLRPVSVGYVRKRGPIAAAAPSAWAELRQLIGATADEAWVGYGLIPGSPGRANSMYFDACIELPNAAAEFHGGLLATQTIAGGVHLCGSPVLSHRALVPALDRLFDDPLIGQGLLIGDARPTIITYSRVAKPGAKRAWSLNLNMPLRWANQSHGQAA